MPMIDGYDQYYRCTQNMPLHCQKTQETVEEVRGAKFCLECGFPTTLPVHAEIRGVLGTYRISQQLRSQGVGRLYEGIQINSGQAIVLKEYLLPSRCFNASETHQRRTALIQVTQSNLDHRKDWEFRLITPVEVIADPSSDRIYFIYPNQVAAAPTLRQVLKENGAFTAAQIRLILNQVLQTLHYLHSQPSQFSADGFSTVTAHGNLGVDSLLMSNHFYIYVCDLASWEQLFIPASLQKSTHAQDFSDLGETAFSLWTGQIAQTGEPLLNPRGSEHWPQEDPPLQEFLHRLLGLDRPFDSAAEARQALLKLPHTQHPHNSLGEFEPESQAKPRSRKYWLLSLLMLPILGGLLWFLLPRSSSNSHAETSQFQHLLPSFADVNGLQPGKYPYTGERLGTWSTILDKKPVSDRNLRSLLSQPKSEIAAMFEYRNYRPQRSPLSEVLNANGKAHFAITSPATRLPEGLMQETIAYDGLLVYIPAYKHQNLPSALQGKLSLDQLKQIFIGRITHWQQLGSHFPSLPIKPYRPAEPEALRLFEQKVLGNDSRLIAQFRKIEQRSTFDTLRAIATGEQQAQKKEAGTISFGLLVQTWDQCKVYPLALTDGKEPPIQPLLRETTNGTLQPISWSDNLCLGKTPLPNVSAFQTAKYLLSAPLIIAYPLANNLPGHQSAPLFARFLKTQDGQYLLQQAGLVPLQPTPKNHALAQSMFNR
jgi:serine/threonine protein kinase